jgi:S-adenosylmethionine/arginine decarboxylase-like enzyme
MVQIYNPNVVGKQMLIDVKNIESDKIKTVEMKKPCINKVIKIKCRWRVLTSIKKDNMPYGATMIHLLSENNLSIHTFVDAGKITFDLFTCSFGVENEKIKKIIKDYIDVNELNIYAYYSTRGN